MQKTKTIKPEDRFDSIKQTTKTISINIKPEERFNSIKIVGEPVNTCHTVSVDTPHVKVQRTTRKNRFQKYYKEVGAFDWRLFGAVIVAEYPDGIRELVDGGHKTGFVKDNLPEVDQVPAIIIPCPSREEAARWFHRFNGTCSANVNAEERFVAQYHGNEAEAQRLYKGLIKCSAYIESGDNRVGKVKHGKAIKIGKWKDLYNKYQEYTVNSCNMIHNNGLWPTERSYNTMLLMGLVELQKVFKHFDVDFSKYQTDFEDFLASIELAGDTQADLTFPELRKDNHYGISVAWGLYQKFYRYLQRKGRHTPFAKAKIEQMYLDAGRRD